MYLLRIKFLWFDSYCTGVMHEFHYLRIAFFMHLRIAKISSLQNFQLYGIIHALIGTVQLEILAGVKFGDLLKIAPGRFYIGFYIGNGGCSTQPPICQY